MSTSSPSPFDLVCENLRKLGAIPLDQYLASISIGSAAPPAQEEDVPVDQNQAIESLEQAVRSTFNKYSISDALQFRIENQPGDSVKCTLTITWPNGASRVYGSQSSHTRYVDAKAEAARIAVSNGGLDFILHGDAAMRESDNKLEGDDPMGINQERQSNSTMARIEDFYQKHCPGRRSPDWIVYELPTTDTPLWGAALRVHLVEPRLYSTDAIHASVSEALTACAQAALDERVLEAISCEEGSPHTNDTTRRKLDSTLTRPSTLQDWYDTLPRPLPDAFGTKPVNVINAAAMLNRWITKARGTRFKLDAFWPKDATFGLFGCVLRIERPKEYRNYYVEPLFVKRSDAKQAASVLAIIHGIEKYIEGVIDEVHNKISPQLRAIMQNQFIPGLTQTPHYWTFEEDRDAFGCTLIVSIGAEEHKYVAEPDYRTKADAKVAAAAIAAERGLPELLRFRGQPIPPGIQTYWETVKEQCKSTIEHDETLSKRKLEREADPGSGRKTKRRKKKGKELEDGEITDTSSQQNPVKDSSSRGLPVQGSSGASVPWNSASASSFLPRNPSVGMKAKSALSGGVSLGITRQSQPSPAIKSTQTHPSYPNPGSSQPHLPAPQFSSHTHLTNSQTNRTSDQVSNRSSWISQARGRPTPKIYPPPGQGSRPHGSPSVLDPSAMPAIP